MTDPAIETKSLSKTYDRPRGWLRLARRGGTAAVREVTLRVESGELFGLLGPNGAGKTTLVKMLATLISPTSGTATVGGFGLHRSGKIRQTVGLVVSDERSFYWRLSGRRNLDFFAAMYGLKAGDADSRVDQVLAEVDLVDEADKRFANYSTGMRQRLAIARSLLHRPSILFLDEPSRSLDPGATGRLHALICRLVNNQPMTIFLITHDLAEAEKLCQRVAVMHQGRIRIVGHPHELRSQLRPRRQYQARVDRLAPVTVAALRQIEPDLRVEKLENHTRLYFQFDELDDRFSQLMQCLHEHQVTIYNIDGRAPTLENVFAHYTDDHPDEADDA